MEEEEPPPSAELVPEEGVALEVGEPEPEVDGSAPAEERP